MNKKCTHLFRCTSITVFLWGICVALGSFATPRYPVFSPESGAEYCNQNAYWPQGCYPVKNQSETETYWVYFYGGGLYEPAEPGDVVVYLMDQDWGSKGVFIYNSDATELLYEGFVESWVGLQCDAGRCWPWN